MVPAGVSRILTIAIGSITMTHHLLGAAGDGAHPAYRDSGMAGSPAAAHPRAWAGADLADAAAAVRAVLDDVRPDVVVTYDATGGYGHPDHVRTHRRHLPGGRLVGRRPGAVRRADPPVVGRRGPPVAGGARAGRPRSRRARRRRPLRVVGRPRPGGDARGGRPVGRPAAGAGAVVARDAGEVVGDGWYALSNHVVSRLAGREGYARARRGDRPADQ